MRARSSVKSPAILAAILVSCLIFSALLFRELDNVPAPLFQDESDGLYRILHYASTGRDVTGNVLPLMIGFNNGFSSYTHPAYFVPVALLSKLTGSVASVGELRAVGVLYCIGTSFLVFILSRKFRIHVIWAAFASFLYLSSPLSQLSSRVAWDPVSLPFWYILAVYALESFFTKLTSSKNAKKDQSYFLNSCLVGLAIGFLWWGYPPGRLLSILLEIYFIIRLLYSSCTAKIRLIGVNLASYLTLFLPVVAATKFDPSISNRTADLLNKPTLLGFYSSFKSLLSHLTYADYLLFWGDPERRHSTGYGGVLGYGGILIVLSICLYLIVRSLASDNRYVFSRLSISSPPIGKLFFYITIASIPAAVTFHELHALRSSASFPFWAIVSAVMFQRALHYLTRNTKIKSSLFSLVLFLGVAYGISSWNYMGGYKSFLSDAQQAATYRGQSKAYFQHSAYLAASRLDDAEVVKQAKAIRGYPRVGDSRILFEYYSRRLDMSNGPLFFSRANR